MNDYPEEYSKHPNVTPKNASQSTKIRRIHP